MLSGPKEKPIQKERAINASLLEEKYSTFEQMCEFLHEPIDVMVRNILHGVAEDILEDPLMFIQTYVGEERLKQLIFKS